MDKKFRVTVMNKTSGRIRVSLAIRADNAREAFVKARMVDRTIMPHDCPNSRIEEI